MTRFSRMLIVCAWCKVLQGWSAPLAIGQTGTSHGICQTCVSTHFNRPARQNVRKEQHEPEQL